MGPSILSAKFSCLAEQVLQVERGGADAIHIDIMDAHFVPNLTIGPLVVAALKNVNTFSCNSACDRSQDDVAETVLESRFEAWEHEELRRKTEHFLAAVSLVRFFAPKK